MKLFELNNKDPIGSYVAVKFSKESTNAIRNFMVETNIPDKLKQSELHSTIVYSRVHLPEFKAHGTLSEPWIATPTGFKIWESKPNSFDKRSTYCLVMTISCKDMDDRHNYAKKDHGATFDFDEYQPHITLSYDVGVGFDVDKLKWTGDPISVISEYCEDLEDD